MTEEHVLVEQVLQLLKKIGVKAMAYSATAEDESPLIDTNDCYILFHPDHVELQWRTNVEISYGDHTAKEILSEFTPDVDGLFDGESQ